jgi:hypothetical protein
VNRFLDEPVETGTMRLYTTAQAIVERGEDKTRHVTEIRRIEHEFAKRSMAQRAFHLAPPLLLQEAPNGSGRLFFNVQPEETPLLRYTRLRLGVIEGLEEPTDEDLLYVEFARGALAKDLAERRDQIKYGRDRIMSELRHGTAPYRMTATGLHVVTRDMIYPLKVEAALPPEG